MLQAEWWQVRRSEREGKFGALERTELVQDPACRGLSWRMPASFMKTPLPLSPKTSESLGLTQSMCSTPHPYMHFCVLLSINRGLNSKLLKEHCSFCFQNILLFLLWHYIFGIGWPSYLPSGDLRVNIYKEMITKSQNGFTENWPCGTNPIFSF